MMTKHLFSSLASLAAVALFVTGCAASTEEGDEGAATTLSNEAESVETRAAVAPSPGCSTSTSCDRSYCCTTTNCNGNIVIQCVPARRK